MAQLAPYPCNTDKIARSSGIAALAVICQARDVDELITDTTADPAALDELRAAGMRVITV